MLEKVLNPRAVFYLSSVFLALVYGFAASHFRWFPYSILAPALEQAQRLSEDPRQMLHRLHPVREDFVGVAAYGDDGAPRAVSDDENRSEVTLLTSYWLDSEDRPGVRLIDRRGDVLHRWNANIRTIWAESPHEDSMAGLLNTEANYVHGTYLFENGDLVFNVENLGMARVRADGELVWRLDRRTHHSIHRNEHGNFWVCAANRLDDVVTTFQRFLGLVPPVFEDLVLEVSPDGEILQEISILEIVFSSPQLKSLIWTTGPAGPRCTNDVLHLNDVEPLPTAIADQYPMFAPGDLMVSLCFINTVLVFDPKTREIKWSATGPHVRQHDPDFIGDGWISIFDNRTDGAPVGQFLGGSRLIAVRPHTGETETIYPRADSGSSHERIFYTAIGGKAQSLDDGGWLITEATAGRVFEIDARGRTVWEWAKQPQPDGGMVSEVLEGHRYPLTPEQVRQWAKP